MQVNAIQSCSNLNFGRKTKNKPITQPVKQSNKIYKVPIYATMIMLPIVNTGCEIRAHAHAESNAKYSLSDTTVTPKDTTIVPRDTIIIPPADTIIHNDTIIKNDTIVKHDTIYIPPEFEFPQQIEDSLNIWRGGYLRTKVDGDDNNLKDKALLRLSGQRDWDYDKKESATLNLKKSDANEARYDHTIIDPTTQIKTLNNDIRITLVKPGDLTVVTKSGKITDQVSGLLFNEDGVKHFLHSNGKDKIFVYDKQTSGENNGLYVFRGTLEPGFLYKSESGENVMLNEILAPDTQDHFTHIKGKVVDVADLYKLEPEETLTID